MMLLSASCEAVFTSSTVANLFHFNVFSIVGNKKKSQGARYIEGDKKLSVHLIIAQKHTKSF
jgi:hypothetical protein